ncbi:MAG: hypothetical protein OEM28_01015 [Nitrosopumilus sp.]|nr:hypothetical protein [Nitrosopumilus sp.]
MTAKFLDLISKIMSFEKLKIILAMYVCDISELCLKTIPRRQKVHDKQHKTRIVSCRVIQTKQTPPIQVMV